MNVLVTGGAGYIGSTLVPMLLAHGHGVRVVDNLLHGGASLLPVWNDPSFDFVLADIRSHSYLPSWLEGMDAVVHLAAIVGDPACARDPGLARETNLDAALDLLEGSRRHGVSRFVVASTCSNYGKMANPSGCVDETSELRPVSVYAETKVELEKAVLDSRCANGFIPTCLRFATVYGVSPRMRFDLTVNEFTKDMLTRKRLVVFGAQFWRPYIHVRDVARAILLVLAAPPDEVRSKVFNTGCTDQNYRKQDLIDLIHRRVPDAVVEYVHRAEDPRDYRVSFEKIHQELGFKATWKVEDGVTEVARLVTQKVLANVDDPAYRN
jgi:nucleoside-diphosphate-sugar epimerase